MINFEDFNPFFLFTQKNRDLQNDLILYIYVLVFLILVYNFVTFVIDKFIKNQDITYIYNRRRLIRYIFIFIGIVAALPVFNDRIAYLPTILAFTGAGFVISMKDITLNFIGWFLIHSRNGFSVGDRIEINHIKGEVVNIGIMRFTLLEVSDINQSEQSTNRLVHVPNNNTIINHFFVISQNMDVVWDEVHIFLSNNSDWNKAKNICNTILEKVHFENKIEEKLNKNLKEISKNFLVKIGTTTPIVYLSISESKILLSLRYLTLIHKRRANRDLICSSILEKFSKEKKIQLYSMINE